MQIDWIEYGYYGLFAGTFLSATIVPLPSEAMVLGGIALGMNPFWVIVVATFGNFLGGLTNYWIGMKADNEKLVRKFGLNREKINLWKQRSRKWGFWLGLISWLPFVGDPMVIALGFLRVPFWPLSLTMFLGKLIRYIVVVWLYLEV